LNTINEEILKNNSTIQIPEEILQDFKNKYENLFKEIQIEEVKKYIANYFHTSYKILGDKLSEIDDIYEYDSMSEFMLTYPKVTNDFNEEKNHATLAYDSMFEDERKITDLSVNFIKTYIKENLDNNQEILKRIPSGKNSKQNLKKAGFNIENLPLAYSSKKLFKMLKEIEPFNGDYYSIFLWNEWDYDLVDFYNDGCNLLGINHQYKKQTFDNGTEKDIVFFKELLTQELPKPNGINKLKKTDKKNNQKIETIRKELKKKAEIEIKTKADTTIVLKHTHTEIQTLINMQNEYEKASYDEQPNKDRKIKDIQRILDKYLEPIIEKIAYIYANNVAVSNVQINLEELFKYQTCKDYLWKYLPTTIYQSLYIDEKTKEEISSIANFNPKDDYPKARAMFRHFYIHYGGTNTGKTYNSIQRLKQAKTGAYLAPLRLLALENQENLLDAGVKCSLTTGEEEDLIPNSTHISSTVEKANYDEFYDVVVIDECQMICDRDRGWAWTQAILGMQSHEIHLCTAPNAVNLLCKILDDCGDTYEIVEHKRVTPLIIENKPFNSLKDVQDGDALILFSKKQVLNTAAMLNELGIECSVIYGALPYDTRKRQFNRFLSGETKVVVSTDAIAMGLNLPIKRIVFLAGEKFDGKEMRDLTDEEVKQIAGRAGRRGIYPEGFVNTYCDYLDLEYLINKKSREIKKANINFPNALTTIDRDLIETIKVWSTMESSELYRKTDIIRLISLINMMPKNALTKSEKLQLANIPFSEDDPIILTLWKKYIDNYVNRDTKLQKPKFNGIEDINELESYYRQLDLYYSFSKNMGFDIDLEWLKKEKLNIAKKINTELVNKITVYVRRCSRCGEPLEWDNFFNLCEDCYREKRGYY
jgi:hypothetical protein